MAIFSRLPWGTTGGPLSLMMTAFCWHRLLLATDGVVNHDPIPVFLIHMAVQRIAGVAVVPLPFQRFFKFTIIIVSFLHIMSINVHMNDHEYF